jgi:hypothetical protein
MQVLDDTADFEEEGPKSIDISPEDWLATESDKIGSYVTADGRTLKIASITDAESTQVRRASMRMNPKTRTLKVDLTTFKRALIVHSINKASGSSLLPDAIAHRPLGELTSLMKAIMALSGMEEDEKPDPEELFA